MPLDPSIALQVKPVQIEAPDFSKTFLTLGQLKYLNAETLRAQVGAQAASEEAARKQTGFEEDAAINRYLSDLSRPRPVAPAPGGPLYDEATLGALPQGGSTPAPASGASAPTSPAQQQGPPPGTVNLFDPEIMAGMRRVAPHTFDAKFKALQEHATTTLNLQKEALAQTTTKIGLVSNFIGGATDQQSLDMGHAFLHQIGIDTSAIPTTWTPDLSGKIDQWTRNGQQRVEQGNKEVDQRIAQQQADTAAVTAKTGRIEATKPLAAGTGYFQHPDGTWTPMAPQPSSPGALRSPQGQGQLDTLKTTFNASAETFEAGTAAYNSVMANKDAHTNAADQVLVKAFQKLAEPGQAIGVAFAHDISGLGNLREQIGGAYNTLLTDTGGTLEAGLRQKIVDTVRRSHAAQIDQHLQRRDEIRAQARQQGLPPDEAAPNRLTTYGSGNRDKVISQAAFDTYVKNHPGVTRGQAVLDLGDKGFTVRGGPQ